MLKNKNLCVLGPHQLFKKVEENVLLIFGSQLRLRLFLKVNKVVMRFGFTFFKGGL